MNKYIMKPVRISKISVQTANKIIIERSRTSASPVRVGSIKMSASEINSAYRKVLSNVKKV